MGDPPPNHSLDRDALVQRWPGINGLEAGASRARKAGREDDRQKKAFKAKLLARGFQESLKPQLDSPTASKDNFKMLMAVVANSRFKLASVDIRAAFLQSIVLDRDIFI